MAVVLAEVAASLVEAAVAAEGAAGDHVMTTPRHTSRGIILKDDKILLMERWRPGKHYFSFPGGGIEPGETSEQTVLREILEETGCVATIERQLYTFRLDDQEHAFFLCRYESGEPHLPEDSPEARQQNPDNRFKPGWVKLTELSGLTFLVWEPVHRRLVQDLATGFSPDAVEIFSHGGR